MKYKIEQVADAVLVVKTKHWWTDPLPAKEVAAAIVEISSRNKITSVCKLGTWTAQYLVIVEKK